MSRPKKESNINPLVTLIISVIALLISLFSVIETHIGNLIAFNNSSSNIVEIKQKNQGRMRVLVFGCKHTYSEPNDYFVIYRAFDSMIFANRGGREVSLVDVNLYEDNIKYKFINIYDNTDEGQKKELPINISAGTAISIALTAEDNTSFGSDMDGIKAEAQKMVKEPKKRGKSMEWLFDFSDGSQIKKKYDNQNFYYDISPNMDKDIPLTSCN